MSRVFTAEEQEKIREYRRAKRREYWNRMPEEERKAKRRAANERFWGNMTPEERRAKRNEYDLHRAINAEARAAAAASDAE